MREFVEQHPEEERIWYENSNTIVLLEVPDEMEIYELAGCASAHEVSASVFYEPDLNGQATAVALGIGAEWLCRKLPLMCSGASWK